MYIKTSIILTITMLITSAQSMVHQKVAEEHRKKVLELIQNTPDLSYLRDDSPLWYIVCYPQLNDLVKLMLDHGANPNIKCSLTNFTALQHAVFGNNVEAIILLLKAGANINSKDILGRTPLHVAVIHGNYEALHTLLHLGAHLNEKNKYGGTPLHTALEQDIFSSGLWKNRAKIVKLLLQYGADPLIQNEYKMNALTIIPNEYARALERAHDPCWSRLASECKTEAQEYKKIARLLIAYVGLCTKQGCIAHESLAQVLPSKIAQQIASYLPEYNFHKESNACPICFEQDTEAKATLACGHNDFHVACLEQWKEMATSAASKCPLCRQEL